MTADDWVFTLQRYARPDYDFEWFSTAWPASRTGTMGSAREPPEEVLGAKKVDDYTFTVKTSRPTLVPGAHLLGSVGCSPAHHQGSSGGRLLGFRSQDGGLDRTLQAGKVGEGQGDRLGRQRKYTGPFPPMSDKIVVSMIPAEARFNAYRNGEVDMIGFLYDSDMTPAAMAQVMNDPKLKEQLITWPNFITFYNFFDTWNPPFDNSRCARHSVTRSIGMR